MLDDLGIFQTDPTHLYEDNEASIAMANAQRPTRRARHVDLRHFSLMDWVEINQIVMSSISTNDNPADGLTKALGPHIFARHLSSLLGKHQPDYCDFRQFLHIYLIVCFVSCFASQYCCIIHVCL